MELKLANLTKRYGQKVALDGFILYVQRGHLRHTRRERCVGQAYEPELPEKLKNY